MILFLVTHYRDRDAVVAFVDHIRALAPDGMATAVAVADNSPDDPFVYAPSPNVAVYRAPGNLGYLNGCAFAYTSWLADGRPDPEIVAVSNTDVMLQDDFLAALVQLDLDGVGVVAPDVRLPGGKPQNPFMTRRPSRRRLAFYRVMFRTDASTLLLGALERIKLGRRTAPSHPRDIYAAHGSIFLLTKAFFARGGMLRLEGLLYAEEIHIAEQARRHGLRAVMAPSLRATHQRRASTGAIARHRRRRWARERLQVVLREYFTIGGS
jgi:GT2 family glycosyltransferase